MVHLYSHFPMIQILASFPSGSSCKSKCGLEGTRRIVGGENSTVSIICYCYCYCGGRRFYGFYHSVFNWQCQIGTCLRGTFISDFWKNLGFCPNQVDPPSSQKVGTPKTKKMMFFCILGYSKHIIFHEKVPFFG